MKKNIAKSYRRIALNGLSSVETSMILMVNLIGVLTCCLEVFPVLLFL